MTSCYKGRAGRLRLQPGPIVIRTRELTVTYVVGYRAEPARHGPVAVVESSITSFQRWYEACDTELDLAVKRLLVYGEKYGIQPNLKSALEAMI